MPADLKTRFGPAAIVTGASDGIGRACAEALAAEGFALVLVARREGALTSLAQSLRDRHGVTVQVIATDLGQPQAVADLLARVADTQIGLLVAAAGFGSLGPFLEQDDSEELAMIDVNCRAVVQLTQGLGRQMARAGRGGIILFGSIVGFQGVPGQATYAATKSFVQSFAEALAIELRPLGVSVLSVAPGPVGTGFAARAGMQMGLADTPRRVALQTLAALPRGGTLRPGLLAKALGWSLATLPRALRVRLLERIMAGMLPRTSRP